MPSVITTAIAAWTPQVRTHPRSADLSATMPRCVKRGTIRVTDMAFDEDVLLDQDRFLSAVLPVPSFSTR